MPGASWRWKGRSLCTSGGSSTSRSAAASPATGRLPSPASSDVSRAPGRFSLRLQNRRRRRSTVGRRRLLGRSVQGSCLRPRGNPGRGVRAERLTIASPHQRHHRYGSRRARSPRSPGRVAVWPDLASDTAAVLDALPTEGLIEAVWQDSDGQMHSAVADKDEFRGPAARIAGADGQRSCLCTPMIASLRSPLSCLATERWGQLAGRAIHQRFASEAQALVRMTSGVHATAPVQCRVMRTNEACDLRISDEWTASVPRAPSGAMPDTPIERLPPFA